MDIFLVVEEMSNGPTATGKVQKTPTTLRMPSTFFICKSLSRSHRQNNLPHVPSVIFENHSNPGNFTLYIAMQ